MVDALGCHKILERIGTGALGDVYRARDTRLGRTVAIKLVPPEIADDPATRERLLTAARAAATLSHPNTASIYEIGEDEDRLFLVLEFVPGDTLRATIAGRAMNPRRALAIAAEVADALADGHAAGIAHRDIRPENIVITPSGRAKLLDFGLSAFTGGGAARERSGSGATDRVALSVAPYLSPEEVLGAGTDHRTDIFSLGSVLHEMLTGQSPFWTSDETAIPLRVVQFTPPRLNTLRDGIPTEVDDIVRRALSKSLNDRYDSAAALASDLRAAAGMLEMSTPAPASWSRGGRSRSRGGRFLSLLVAAAVAAAVAWFGRAALVDRWRRTFAAPPAPILVVAPFLVASGSGTPAYVGEGIAEEIGARLAQIPELHLRGQSSPHRPMAGTPGGLARSAGAAAALTGIVDTIDDQVAIDLQVIDAASDAVIWSGRYQRPMTSLFAIEVEVAEQIASRFRIRLESNTERARTLSRAIDPGAHDLYFQARQAVFGPDRSRAIALYERAVEQDPGLAEAHAGLAEAIYLDRLERGAIDAAGTLDPVQRAAASAAAIDAELPQTQRALGYAAPGLVAGLTAFRRAIDVAPSLADGYVRAGQAILALDPARAARLFETALRLDPFGDARLDLARAYARLRTFDRAATELERVRQFDPGGRQWMPVQAAVDFGLGQPGTALARLPKPVEDMPLSFLIFARAGRAAGRADWAIEISQAIAMRYPAACAPQIVSVALTTDRGKRFGVGYELRRWIGSEQQPVSTTGSAAVCAALASAAIGDGEEAARWLHRIAADDATLDVWLREGPSGSERAALEGGWYPWNQVAEHPTVRAAQDALQRAYARRLAQVEPILANLSEP